MKKPKRATAAKAKKGKAGKAAPAVEPQPPVGLVDGRMIFKYRVPGDELLEKMRARIKSSPSHD